MKKPKKLKSRLPEYLGKPWEALIGGNFVRIGIVGYRKEVDALTYLAGPSALLEMDDGGDGHFGSKVGVNEHGPLHSEAIAIARHIVMLHNNSLE